MTKDVSTSDELVVLAETFPMSAGTRTRLKGIARQVEVLERENTALKETQYTLQNDCDKTPARHPDVERLDYLDSRLQLGHRFTMGSYPQPDIEAKTIRELIDKMRGGADEPTADRYVGEQEHIPAPISGGTSTITGYDPSTRRAVLSEPPADRKSALDEIVRISEEAGLYNRPTPRRADQWSPEEIARARMEQSINMCQGCFRPMNVCVCSQMNRTGD